MATTKPKTYNDEFKEFLVQEAIILGQYIASIARDNGINQNLLHNWKREQKAKLTSYLHASKATVNTPNIKQL